MDSKNKFVFEKFEHFVQFLEENVINEAQSFSSLTELQTFLGSNGMDKEGKQALSSIEELAKKSAILAGGFKKEDFTALALTLNRLSIPDVTEISDVTVKNSDLEYGNVLGGTVLTERGERVNIADLFTKVNKSNLDSGYKTPIVNKDKKRFESNKDGDKEFYQGSGALRQYVLLDIPGKLDFKKWTGSDPVKGDVAGSWSKSEVEPASKKLIDSSYQSTFFLYYPTGILPGKGESFESTELIETVRPVSTTSTKLEPIVIQDDNVLFDLNKSVLKEEGKAAILNALSDVATAKSIEVTGGASKEGDRARNEVLCKERAQAVADFLKSGSFKNAQVTVSDVADIQPADSKDPLEIWRKVTLNIDGESLVTKKETGQEKVLIASNLSKKMDKLTFREVRIEISGSIVK
jgi:outer membrane protein OmpA-like peptidoglycan-associated protein